jgi:hypothetical protein
MEAKELRVGNYVDTEDGVFMVAEIHKNDIIMMNDLFWARDFVKPIPLTEEWLLKFGLNSSDYITLEKNECILLDIHQDTVWIGDKEAFEYAAGIHIQHVHQLQNLYYALTNEELTIKN